MSLTFEQQDRILKMFTKIPVKRSTVNRDSVPHITFNKDGVARFNSSFFKNSGNNSNGYIELRYCWKLGILRFRFNTNVQPNMLNGSFRFDPMIANSMSQLWRILFQTSFTGPKTVWVIVRKDDDGWYTAKITHHRFETKEPEGLSPDESKFFNLPHNLTPENS